MGRFLRILVIRTVVISHVLVVADAAALAMDARPVAQTASAEQPFLPLPPGIPERRLSGGTR